MAKAQLIENLIPEAPLCSMLPEIFSVRIAELWGWAAHMPYPDRVRELHDMRIAAKRLRYCFEFFQASFPASFKPLQKQFKKLQDFLGEIHDCDVWVDYLRAQLAETMREQNRMRKDLLRFVGAADPVLGEEARQLREELGSGTSQGLLMMIEDVVDRRSVLYAGLLEFWAELEAAGFRGKLSSAVGRAASSPEAKDPSAQTQPTAAENTTRVAAIDVGSNSLKLLVLECTASGYTILHDESRITGLGQEVGRTGRLSADAKQLSLTVLQEYADIAADCEVGRIRAAGTAALRNAVDGAEFAALVQSETGIPLAIITGEDEAKLAREVALSELPDKTSAVVFFDVGGGSTELTHCLGGEVTKSVSLELGARQLTDAAAVAQPVGADMQIRMEGLISKLLAGAPSADCVQLAGLGGTASNLIWLLRGQRGVEPGDPHLADVSLDELNQLAALIGPLGLDAVRALRGLDPKRAPVIYAGLTIIRALLMHYGAANFVLIDRGLRYGLALAERLPWETPTNP